MSKLLIVRHALAAPQEDLRLPGLDLPLLPEGREQAQALANRLQPLNPTAIYSSDAQRARQTGEIIAAACHAELHLLPELREIDLGEWSGQTFAAITAHDPLAARWFKDPSGGAPPGGEAAEAAAARVRAVFANVAQGQAERVVIVGHAGSLRLALAEGLGMPLSAYWRLRLDCAGLSSVSWTSEGPIVEGLNDVSHLGTP